MISLDDRLKEMSSEDKNTTERYFKNSEILQKVFNVVRKNFQLTDPIGNYDSRLFLIINDDISLNNPVIKIIKSIYECNNTDMYDTYITLYKKTNNKQINDMLIEKELQIMQPVKVVSLGYNYGSHYISEEDYLFFASCIGDKEKIKQQRYLKIKTQFIELLKYIIIK